MNKPTKWQLAKFFTHFGFTGYGGVAMLPYIRRDLVERKKYLDSEQFDFGLAMAQMLPGATLVQVATYTGYQTQGYVGAFIAALGIFAPAAQKHAVYSTCHYWHERSNSDNPHRCHKQNRYL